MSRTAWAEAVLQSGSGYFDWQVYYSALSISGQAVQPLPGRAGCREASVPHRVVDETEFWPAMDQECERYREVRHAGGEVLLVPSRDPGTTGLSGCRRA